MNLKKISNSILLLAAVVLITACELDNFEGPDAGLYGQIVDEETGELVPQDIINGTLIEIWEDGWDPVTPQRLEVKNDGTYQDSRLFGNSYTIIPVNTNFHNNFTKGIDTLRMEISGQTELDFTVLPYARIVDLEFNQSGTKVIANFKIEQPLDSVFLNESDTVRRAVLIEEVELYAHFDPNLGREMNLGKTTERINEVIQPGVNDEYRLELDISRNSDLSVGGKIFFRIGAISDMPTARPNYGSTVEFDF